MSEKNESRDWELTCDHCDGSGHVFVERQVAERKTDVQEFKEECDCCEGRGFTIAFEDIPGIEAYVKSCRPASDAPLTSMARAIFGDQIGGQMDAMAGTPAPSAPGDAQDESIALDRLADYIADNWPDKKYSLEEICQRLNATWPGAFMPAAPAAGDARKPDFARAEQIAADFVQDYEWRGEDVAGRDTCYTPNKRERTMITDAILGLLAEPEFVAALAAQVPQQGEA